MKEGKGQKRIGIDARFYGPIGKGLGRYTKEIVDRVVSLDNDNFYVIFLSPDNYNDFSYEGKNVKKVLVRSRWYSLKEQIFFPIKIWKEKLDLMHFTHFNVPIFLPVKFVVTIHDLILTKFNSRRASKLNWLFYRLKYLAYKFVILRAVKKSEKIITVSEFTKKDILKKFKINGEKVSMIYEGVFSFIDLDGAEEKLEKKYSFDINEPFLLYVGNAYPHKNLEGLINIFIKLKNKKIKLVLVGHMDYFYNRIKDLSIKIGLSGNEDKAKDRIIFPGYVPDNDLGIFFKKATAYIFPSLYEGFGLPPLEAMSKSCPVISSNQGSLKEILDYAAYYFNPYNIEESCQKIDNFLEDKKIREEYIEKGLERIKFFSWDKAAKETLEVYKEII
ncbi:glycosyltransferase family 1 protein [bacterium]|nr:glycosyltransferase family 1 protein [bacterium]